MHNTSIIRFLRHSLMNTSINLSSRWYSWTATAGTLQSVYGSCQGSSLRILVKGTLPSCTASTRTSIFSETYQLHVELGDLRDWRARREKEHGIYGIPSWRLRWLALPLRHSMRKSLLQRQSIRQPATRTKQKFHQQTSCIFRAEGNYASHSGLHICNSRGLRSTSGVRQLVVWILTAQYNRNITLLICLCMCIWEAILSTAIFVML